MGYRFITFSKIGPEVQVTLNVHVCRSRFENLDQLASPFKRGKTYEGRRLWSDSLVNKNITENETILDSFIFFFAILTANVFP